MELERDPVRADLPAGTVTFLFTDVEGSTQLLHALGPEGYADALAEHRRILRDAFSRRGGVEVDTQGDAFFVAFPTSRGAVQAADQMVSGLEPTAVRVRIGIHTGTPHLTDEGYVGADVNKGARIAAAGHGGQVLLSKETNLTLELDTTDLGEHRLKDFAQPVWIFQLGSKRFPPLKTISNTNLPHPASSFVGREQEVAEVKALLLNGARLVTLSGPGGTGKTRLSIETASELVSEFLNGVFWVGLATLTDPGLVMDTIAQTIGAKDGVAEHISERDMLLVLDNLEQVIDAAPQLSPLLAACPNLRLLVTSRELLRINGEVEFAVPPLAETEAIELFCSRSGHQADNTIAELCRRLDNLPLAVELAAARTNVLSPHKILDRLSKSLDLFKGGRDSDPRQATLRATIEWSHDLLSAEEKELFARLAVFRGGSTLEAAEEVADADIDTLQSVVDKSLVRHTDDRFWMLETIRTYSVEMLRRLPDVEALHARHAHHFLVLAEEAESHLREYSKEWLDRIEEEHDNMRAALDHLQASGDTQSVLRLAGSISEFWDIRGHHAEAGRRLEDALVADDRPTSARAKALNAASTCAMAAQDAELAERRAEEALSLHREAGDAWGTALSLFFLGDVAANRGDWDEGRRLFEASVLTFRDVGDEHLGLWASRMLSWMYSELGDFARSGPLHIDNLRLARKLGNTHLQAECLEALAFNEIREGQTRDAVPFLKEANLIWVDLGDTFRLGVSAVRFARVLAAEGLGTDAARCMASAELLLEEYGATPPWVEKMKREALTAIEAQEDQSGVVEAGDEGRRMAPERVIALALASLETRPSEPV